MAVARAVDLVWAEAFCAGFAEVFAAALVAVSGFVDLASAAFFAVLLAVLFDALDESGGFLADPLASFVEDLTCSLDGGAAAAVCIQIPNDVAATSESTQSGAVGRRRREGGCDVNGRSSNRGPR